MSATNEKHKNNLSQTDLPRQSEPMPPKKISRRNFFKDYLPKTSKKNLGKFWRTDFGKSVDRELTAMANFLAPINLPPPTIKKKNSFAHPPGAQKNFLRLCTRCGECKTACPYQAIEIDSDLGAILDVNHQACYLCEDTPCIKSCPEKALLPLSINDAASAHHKMKGKTNRLLQKSKETPFENLKVQKKFPNFGVPVFVADHCLNQETANSCDECIQACPIDNAIQSSKISTPIFQEQCVGCGICRASCPSQPKSIFIHQNSLYAG